MKKQVAEILHPAPEPENPSPITRDEALQMIAKQLRRPKVAAAQVIKLLTLQTKIMGGWGNPNPDVGGEPDSLDKQVRDAERKRRETKTQDPIENKD